MIKQGREEDISATEFLIRLLGAIALLLWGLRMVRSGVTRCYGSSLRNLLGEHLQNRFAAFLAGVGVTALLQSSTATCLMTASFASRGLVAMAPALSIMLGADVGTTLVAQLFSFPIGWLSPILLLFGVIAYNIGHNQRTHELGRVAVGIGLLLLALRLIVDNAAALRGSQTVLMVIESLADEPLLAVLIGVLLTWLAHSSLAIVLLVVSLVGTGAVPLPLAFALVLGANIGGTVPPIVATLSSAPAARRVAWGNAVFKLVGSILVLLLLEPVAAAVAFVQAEPVRQVVNFHMAFNLALAAVLVPLTGVLGDLAVRFMPDPPGPPDEAAPRYLDPAAQGEPALALACAARETLRMGDTLDLMLRGSLKALRSEDPEHLRRVSRMDDTIDRLHEAIKLYLTDIRRQPLDAEESRRWTDIMSFTTNLEHIGDIVDKNLIELAAKKIRYGYHFSDDGLAEIEALHRRVQENLQLAVNVFVSGDRQLARRLLEEKERFRELEFKAAENHHERLRHGKRESIETSSLHLDIVRDLKRINSHLTSVAYPILDKAGQLRRSRLKEEEAPAETPAAAASAPPTPERPTSG